MSTDPFYLVEKTPPIAHVWLNRPEKKNAMNAPAWKEPAAVFEDLDKDSDIRAVILAGKGPCFSTGIDLASMLPEIPELTDPAQKGVVKWRLIPKLHALQDAITCIEACRKPVIAAVHRHCIGAGLDMIAACDIRICSEDAIFSLREAALGIVADVGALQRIPKIVGQGMARELAFTARFFNAAEAKEMLLVNRVFPDHEALWRGAEALAADIAANSPLAVQASKDVLNYCADKSNADGLKYVAAVSANIIPSDDLEEAMTAFMERRKPIFR